MLIHPVSRKSVSFQKGVWVDEGGLQVPSTRGIPWLYSLPQSAIADWRLRWSAHLGWLDQEIDELGRELGLPALQGAAKTRVEKLRKARIAHKNLLSDKLKPLELLPNSAITALEALRARLPMNQSFMGYYPNILRDWGWGAAENAAHAQLCESVLPANLNAATTLIVGAGAGRLSYDLAPKLHATELILTDIDPLLLLSAQTFFAGEKHTLWDFPLQPKSSQEVAIEVSCGTGVARPAQFVLADAFDLPVPDGSLDLIVLPWVLDVLPSPAEKTLPYFNRLLKDGGHLLFFGPTGFAHRDRRFDLCADELPEAFARAGLQIEKMQSAYLPYMQSPHSSHHRSEWVTAALAKKTSTPAKTTAPRRLPDWLEASKSPVPLLPHFAGFMAKNQIYNQVVSQIDGLSTLEDLTQKLAPNFHLSVDETRELLRNFLFQLFEETRFRAF